MKFKCERFCWFSQLGFSGGDESSLAPEMLLLISAQQAGSQAAPRLQPVLRPSRFPVHPNVLEEEVNNADAEEGTLRSRFSPHAGGGSENKSPNGCENSEAFIFIPH